MHTVNILIHLVENHQLLIYFIILFGLIFEGEVILITSGILVHLGALNLWTVLFFVFCGSLLKTFCGYYLGMLIHDRWQDVRFFQFFERRLRILVPQFKEKPFWSIFISKFIMGAHTTVVLFSGFERINFEKYLKAEILACIIWAPGLIFLGYFFSYTAIHVSHEIWKFSLIVILLVLLFIILDKILAWAYEMFEEFYQK